MLANLPRSGTQAVQTKSFCFHRHSERLDDSGPKSHSGNDSSSRLPRWGSSVELCGANKARPEGDEFLTICAPKSSCWGLENFRTRSHFARLSSIEGRPEAFINKKIYLCLARYGLLNGKLSCVCTSRPCRTLGPLWDVFKRMVIAERSASHERTLHVHMCDVYILHM